MNLRLLLLLLPLGTIACTPTDKPTPAEPVQASEPAGKQTPVADAGAALAGYRWKLESATDAQGKRIDALFPGGDRALSLSFEAAASAFPAAATGSAALTKPIRKAS